MIVSAGTKTKIALIIGVFAAIVLALAVFLLEGLGTFVGFALDKPCVSKYLKKNYPGLVARQTNVSIYNGDYESMGIIDKKIAYVFEFEVISYDGNYKGIEPGIKFTMEAYKLSVKADGLFTSILRDDEVIDDVNNEIFNRLLAYGEYKENGLTPMSAYTNLHIMKDDGESLSSVLDKGLAGDAMVLHFKGEKTTFSDYIEKTLAFVHFFKDNSDLKPGSVRIIYWYDGDNGETMAYESQFADFELDYNDEMILGGTGMHYIIELDEKQQKQLAIYNAIKGIYLIAVLVIVVALMAVWVVKKVKKLKRFEDS